MARSDSEKTLKENIDIVWVGKANDDFYWEECQNDFAIQSYSSIYEAVADLLIDARTKCIILNAGSVYPDLMSTLTLLLSSQLAPKILIYSPIKQFLLANIMQFDVERVSQAKSATHLYSLVCETISKLSDTKNDDIADDIPEFDSSRDIVSDLASEIVDNVDINTVNADTNIVDNDADVIDDSAVDIWPKQSPDSQTLNDNDPSETRAKSIGLDILIQDSTDFDLEATSKSVEIENKVNTVKPVRISPKAIETPEKTTSKDERLVQLTADELDALLSEDFVNDKK